MSAFRTLLVVMVAGLALAAPAFASAATAAFDLDLRTSAGTRVASVAGSVNARGTGFADVVPLSGSTIVGMRRGETAVATREADGAILIRGGLGTRIRVRVDQAAGTATASGTLALDLRAARVVAVTGTGVSTDRPYTPRKGDTVVAIGYPSGPIRIALARRYRIVRYSAATWSRTALLAHPQRIARVAGVLVGPTVTEARLRHLDLVRALYNAGRWTATSSTPLAFDRHMYIVAHAHVGRAGVILRHPGGLPGQMSRTYLQIREPRVARVRIGSARVGRDRVPRSVITSAVRRSLDRLTEQIAARETPTGEPQGAGRRSVVGPAVRQAQCPQSASPSNPATVCQSGSQPAYYQVPISMSFQVVLSAPNALSAYGIKWSCAQNQSGNAYFPGTCPGKTNTQTIDIQYQPIYMVSLPMPDSTTTGNQFVTETNSITVDGVTNIDGQPAGVCPAAPWTSASADHLAQGYYNPVANTVCPTVWSTPEFFTSGEGCRFGCYEPALDSAPQQSALLLAMSNHTVVMQCVGYPGASSTGGCTTTGSPSGSVSIEEDNANSFPIQAVQNVTSSYSTGSDWQTSVTTSKGWDVGANLGFFGGEPMGGLSGGYNSSTATTNSVGGNIQSSISYDESNWITNPDPGTPLPNAGLWSYTSVSLNIPNAGGDAASAASGVNYPESISATSSGYVPTPAVFGGSGPGPNCTKYPSACQNAAPIAGWGSAENVTDFSQGSTATFGVSAGSKLFAVGTASPSVVDNLYFADQWNIPGGQPYSSLAGYGPGLVAFSQLQIRNQSDVYGAGLEQSSSATQLTPQSASGAGNVGGTTTYYSAQGQVSLGPQAGGYETIGLDLCAPPVLTAEMWTSGCDSDPMLTGAGAPPATVAGANPAILVNGQAPTLNNGAPTVFLPTPAFTCDAGTWSGDPTFSYAWEVWLPTGGQSSGVWGPVTSKNGTVSQNGQAFTPTVPGAYTCVVTATNSAAPQGVTAQTATVVAAQPGS